MIQVGLCLSPNRVREHKVPILDQPARPFTIDNITEETEWKPIKRSPIYHASHRTRYDISAVQTSAWNTVGKKGGNRFSLLATVDVPCIVESSSEIINLTKRHYPSTMLNSIIDLSERRVEEGSQTMEGRGRWYIYTEGGRTSQKLGGGEDGYWVLLFHFTFITETVEY